MQNTHAFIRLPLIVVTAMGLLISQIELNAAREHEDIPLRKLTDSSANEGAPRYNSFIEAYYDTELSCVCVHLANSGTIISVELVNNTTNETACFVIQGSSSSILPISGTAGCWTITLTLIEGTVYFGEFVL